MLNAQRSAAKHLPRSGLRANEHSEPAMSFPGVADGAASEAGGAGGGQHAPRPAKSKSRRWRDGDSRREKSVAQPLAWWSTDTVAAGKPQAGERPFAGQRSGVAAAGWEVRR